MGAEEGWTSTVDTDYDRDGCEDLTEDIDDDGDFLPDFDDDCLSELGWISNETTDHEGMVAQIICKMMTMTMMVFLT